MKTTVSVKRVPQSLQALLSKVCLRNHETEEVRELKETGHSSNDFTSEGNMNTKEKPNVN